MRTTSAFALALLLAPTAFANLFITTPTASTSANAAANFDITWIPQNVRSQFLLVREVVKERDAPAGLAGQGEINKGMLISLEQTTAPLPSAYGPTSVALMTGSQTTQFVLQTFGTLQDPSITVKVVASIDPTVGPNSDAYFIRFQSVSGVDANKVPLQAFSARFTLKGMTGTFTSAMLAANAGASDSSSIASVTTGLASVVSNSTARVTRSAISIGSTGSTKNAAIQTASGASGTGTATSTRTAATTSATSSTSGARSMGKFEFARTGVAVALVAGLVALVL